MTPQRSLNRQEFPRHNRGAKSNRGEDAAPPPRADISNRRFCSRIVQPLAAGRPSDAMKRPQDRRVGQLSQIRGAEEFRLLVALGPSREQERQIL
jgi:hypothetical protein